MKIIGTIRISMIVVVTMCFSVIMRNAYPDDEGRKFVEKNIQYIIDQDGEKQEQAIRYLKENLPVEAPEIISDALISEGDTKQKLILLSILKMYNIKSVKDQLIAILGKTENLFVKVEILNLFGKSGDKDFVMPISKELEDEFYEVRKAAIIALKEIGDDRMFPVIFRLAESGNPVFRIYALEALNQVYDMRLFSIVQSFLNDENKSIRIYALDCVEKNDLEKLLPTVRNISLSDSNSEVRIAAINTLLKMNDASCLNVLLKALPSENRDIRFISAVALERFRFRQSAVSISEQLNNETDGQIKNVLIDALIGLKDGGGFKGLESVIIHDGNPLIRIKAAYALGVIGGARSEALLIKALKDPEYKIRAEACNSLGIFRDKVAVQALIGMVNDDPERYVRLAALYAIERIRDRSTVIPLFDRYSIENDYVFKKKLYDVTRVLIQTAL